MNEGKECISLCTLRPKSEGKGLKWHALVWARLDGCILDKIPRASVSRASWAGRGGQSCSIQLRILDITVLVARVLETREVKGVWGVSQPKNMREWVRQTDRERSTTTDEKNYWLMTWWPWGNLKYVSSSAQEEVKDKCTGMKHIN